MLGIGVGLYPYIELFKELNQGRREKDGELGIIAIEILPISSRITTPLPRKQEMCHQIGLVLQRHHFDRFVLVSHSWVFPPNTHQETCYANIIRRYGSVIATHLLKTPELASKVSSLVLVDPVSILLHQPDVAYNFVRLNHAKRFDTTDKAYIIPDPPDTEVCQ